jgi:hypothetical protein
MRYCPENGAKGGKQKNFHTVLKAKKLDGAVRYCDGKYAVSPTKPVSKTSRFSAMEGYVAPLDGVPEHVSEDGPEDALQAAPEDDFGHAKAWQNDPEAIKLQQQIAKEDGYPFPKGMGSESVIPDSDLGDDTLDEPKDPPSMIDPDMAHDVH